MHYFLSAGEPSGDLHGANLIRQIERQDPAATFTGFGGDKMRAARCELLYPLADHPIMGLTGIVSHIPLCARLLRQASQTLARSRPDVLVLIDNPGFNWHMAKRAKRLGIPVVYYVPPQIWAWLTHRVAKIRKFVDHVLCTLPFEEAWYHGKGIADVTYVGHPFFDELRERRLDDPFLARVRDPVRPLVALLPGSRGQEVRANAEELFRAAARLRAKMPAVRFFVGAFKEAHRGLIEEQARKHAVPAEVHVGRTPEIIHAASAAFCVSGSISLELMYHGVPAVIVYKVGPFANHVIRPLLIETPHITLVNLMAGRRLFPEYVGSRDFSEPMAWQVAQWLADPAARASVTRPLATLRELYGAPGAAQAAARYITRMPELGRRAAA